ncbi:hypothetical protein [Pseudomonas sp. COW5]|uniref:hypothetical protein n=1 Tax=Pseudomonas sp. COW5 TaxID=2981253 RepID=UPI0022455641|nr:hypothetical protein [Pseudomonas sp. COW5]MCX2542012.1 hypothetical protein [Pseudomonas sp. COW5]
MVEIFGEKWESEKLGPYCHKDEDMTAPYKWTIGFADAYAHNNGDTVQDFLSLVVQPSLAALEQKRQELARAAQDDVVFHFALSDHERLIQRTYMTFALAIQSLWEQQIRSYLICCLGSHTIDGVTLKKLEKSAWGTELNALFFKVRGVELSSFDSYPALTQLQLLGNACRHGDGDSSRDLHSLHPELWPAPIQFPWLDSSMEPPPPPKPPVQHLQITLDILTRYVSAIALFWVDMDRLGMESLLDRQPDIQHRVMKLLESRIPLLEVVTGIPRSQHQG